MKSIAIIPARYSSTRFPGKPLVDIEGKPMVVRVYERVEKAVDEVWVATDDKRIFDTVQQNGGNVVMTSADHQSGTDRIKEAYHTIVCDAPDKNFDVIVNVQGDEPFVNVEDVQNLVSSFENSRCKLATLVHVIESMEDISNPNNVKVVVNNNFEAMYFSRSIIPYPKNNKINQTYYKHIGMYGYTPNALNEITELEMSSLEFCESLEQLRWLQNGYSIKCSISSNEAIGIDTPKDLQKAIECGLTAIFK